MTPVVRQNWQVQVRGKAYTKEIFNSDQKKYWGSGNVFNPVIKSELINKSENLQRLYLNLPPLAAIILK